MGQCVSSKSHQKVPDPGHKYLQPSCLHLHDFSSSPPPKDKPQAVQFTKVDQNSKASSFSYGSEKEAFYDTQPWLDSDCEDDFYSVNGAFTPSRGSTPFQVSFASPEIRRSPYFHSSALTNSTPCPGLGQSPRKKSLSDLFEESGRYVSEEGILAVNCNEVECVYASATYSPCILRARYSYTGHYSGQKTPEGNVIERKVSSLKLGKSCLPQLLLSQSFSSSKKKGITT